MTLRRSLFLFGLLLFLTSSCHHNQTDVKKAAVITVNGQSISAADFGAALARRLKIYDALAAKDATNIKKAEDSIMKEFVISALLTQFAKDKGLSISDEEVDAEMDRLRKTYPDDLTFKASLASEGKNLEDWKAELKQTLLERKAFAALSPKTKDTEKAALQAAKKYYESHRSEFQRPAEVHLQQILVTKEDDAERIAHALKSGASFSDLAKKFSISPEGKTGGDLGYLPKGISPAFDSAFNLRPGQVSGVIKSSYGFHIIKVLDKKSAGLEPFEKAQAELIRSEDAKREQAAFNAWLETALKNAKVERNEALLEKLKVRTEGEGE